MRASGAIAVVLLLALSAFASSASAAPLSMTFTEARANVGAEQLSDAALFEAPATAPFAAQIDPGSGDISVGALEVPEFETHITAPIDADVTVAFDIGEIAGSFDQATGTLTLSGTAGGTLTSEGEECTVSAGFLTLSTSTAASTGGSPRSGAPFTAGLAGAGAIAGKWDDMQADPVSEDEDNVWFCGHVDDSIGGPGGVWLEQEDLVPPAAPRLTRTDPASGNLSGTPRILGAAAAGSTVRIYAGTNCAGAPIAAGGAAELGWPGIAVAVAPGLTAAFSATATDAAGNTSACSAPISYARLKDSGPLPLLAPACVVPKLAGKTLARAKTAVRAAGCKVGQVLRPKRLKGKRRGPLVVKWSSPGAGASPANRKVHLKLGPKPRKRTAGGQGAGR